MGKGIENFFKKKGLDAFRVFVQLTILSKVDPSNVTYMGKIKKEVMSLDDNIPKSSLSIIFYIINNFFCFIYILNVREKFAAAIQMYIRGKVYFVILVDKRPQKDINRPRLRVDGLNFKRGIGNPQRESILKNILYFVS